MAIWNTALETSSAIESRSIACAGLVDRRPGEQLRDHRPQLGQQERDGDQPDVRVQALVEREQPARRCRPVEEQRQVAIGGDDRVPGQVRHVGRVREESGRRHDPDQHQQDRAERTRQPRAAERRAPEPGPERAGRRGARPRAIELGHAAAQRHERAAADLAGRRRPRTRPAPPPRADTVDADARPSEPLRDLVGRLDPDPLAQRRRPGRIGLDHDRAARPEQLSGAPEQRDGIAADADVAVQQQDRPPRAGHVGPQRAVDHVGAAIARERHRDRGEIDAEAALAERPQRRQMPAGAATEVEDRRLEIGEDLQIDLVGGRQPAIEREWLEAAVGVPDPGADRRSLRRGGEQAAVEQVGGRGRWRRSCRDPVQLGQSRREMRCAAPPRPPRARRRTCRRRAAQGGSRGRGRARPCGRAARRRCERCSSARPRTRRGPACAARCPSSRRRAPGRRPSRPKPPSAGPRRAVAT